jgi:hypothetical protein
MMMSRDDVHFSFSEGPPPLVVVTETVEIENTLGTSIRYLIGPGAKFCELRYEDMARKESGHLVFDEAGCASIAAGPVVGKLGLS